MARFALRVPDSLMSRAKRLAEGEHTSLNQFFVTAIAEKLASLDTEDLLGKRAAQADVPTSRRSGASSSGCHGSRSSTTAIGSRPRRWVPRKPSARVQFLQQLQHLRLLLSSRVHSAKFLGTINLRCKY